MGVLDGKVALITGGGSGIGLATSQLFASEGAQVAMFDRNADLVNETAREIGSSAFAISGDVTSEDDVARMVASCVERFGRLDIAFNNAGIAGAAPIHDHELSHFQHVIDVCLTGVFLCLKHQSKQLIAQGQGGSLINTASINATQATKGLSAYCSAKAGVAMLTKVSALELGEHGIRVNAIGPGHTRTPMTERARDVEGFDEAMIGATPLGRLGEPEDLARMALFLGSDASPWVSGQLFYVDGGITVNELPPGFNLLEAQPRQPRGD
ncbi:MAG: SDR family NAD(P)-dependent oxidoreductase [Chloroflexota bacterium]|nr:SDR family NAD(P)-dependent oxidoreductase [Chloroflexota bacterium]